MQARRPWQARSTGLHRWRHRHFAALGQSTSVARPWSGFLSARPGSAHAPFAPRSAPALQSSVLAIVQWIERPPPGRGNWAGSIPALAGPSSKPERCKALPAFSFFSFFARTCLFGSDVKHALAAAAPTRLAAPGSASTRADVRLRRPVPAPPRAASSKRCRSWSPCAPLFNLETAVDRLLPAGTADEY